MVTLCEAIARQEGWLVSNSRCRRNNNPGNIRAGGFTRRHGAVGSDGVFAIFPDVQTGFRALSELLEAYYCGMTLCQAMYKYAPPNENNTERYIEDIVHWTGLTPHTVLTDAILAPPEFA